MIDLSTGISIVMNRWLDVRRGELILLVTDETHRRELEAFERWARGQDAVLKPLVLSSDEIQSGRAIDAIAPLLATADVILGATDYSFITTRPVAEAVARGTRFLSLPLSCSDGTSLLENDFVDMDTGWAKRMAGRLLRSLGRQDTVHITPALGTDLTFRYRQRQPGSYCGLAEHRGIISSASFEVYIPIEEDQTEGRLVLDGSLGYLGQVSRPIEITFCRGRLTADPASPDGRRLTGYIENFHDPKMYQAAELGIGLNTVSRCRGVSYIEDESAYRTFHIGLGRNITLGGRQEAAGHFDIVTHRPTITAGDVLLMREGEIVL